MKDYSEFFAGLPIMYGIVVVAMVVVILAMCMDCVSGWQKAKARNEARTSYLFSRSISKFTLYEGALFISAGIDTLVHFVWAQLLSSVYCVPIVTCIAGIVLCLVEIWSMHEKADEKTRRNLTNAVKVVSDAVKDGQIAELAKMVNEVKQDNSEM